VANNAGAVPGTSARPADVARMPPQHGGVPLPLPHVGRPPRHHRRRQIRNAGEVLQRDPPPPLCYPRPLRT